MSIKPVTDVQLLDALLACDRLDANIRPRFQDMRSALGRSIVCLSQNQRAWAQGEAAKLGLVAASGAAKVEPYRKQVSAWDPEPRRKRR